MYGDYKKFTCSVDNVTLFNTNSFIVNRNSKYKNFYVDFTQTGNFRQFLQISAKESFPLFDDACNKIKNMKLRVSESFQRLNTEVNFSVERKTKPKNTSASISIFKNKANTDLEFNQTNCSYDTKSIDNFENIILAPFFINEPVFKLDSNKIEEYISQKYPLSLNNKETQNKIFDYINEINLNGTPVEIKRYNISNKFDNLKHENTCSEIKLKKINKCNNMIVKTNESLQKETIQISKLNEFSNVPSKIYLIKKISKKKKQLVKHYNGNYQSRRVNLLQTTNQGNDTRPFVKYFDIITLSSRM